MPRSPYRQHQPPTITCATYGKCRRVRCQDSCARVRVTVGCLPDRVRVMYGDSVTSGRHGGVVMRWNMRRFPPAGRPNRARPAALALTVLALLACGAALPAVGCTDLAQEPDSPASATSPVKRVRVSTEEVVHGPVDQPRVSLVVNAGAGFTPAEEMLDTLAGRGVHTPFCLMGWWAERNPDLVRRIYADGHEIASHGHSVFDLTSVSDAAVAEDLERADAVISAITGQTTRPLWSASAGYRD